MTRSHDNTGDKLHTSSRFTFLSYSESRKGGVNAFFLCSCGNLKEIPVSRVARGQTKSCGCARKEFTSSINKKDGRSSHYLYGTYNTMMQRCFNPNRRGYDNYGGRGITVCPRWSDPEEGFYNFVSDMGDRPTGSTLERVDTEGDYSPSNCKWEAEWRNQIFNRRPRKNKSGRTGVQYKSQWGYWTAEINYTDVGRTYLGSFKSFEDAVRAREKAEIESYGRILNYD